MLQITYRNNEALHPLLVVYCVHCQVAFRGIRRYGHLWITRTPEEDFLLVLALIIVIIKVRKSGPLSFHRQGLLNAGDYSENSCQSLPWSSYLLCFYNLADLVYYCWCTSPHSLHPSSFDLPQTVIAAEE